MSGFMIVLADILADIMQYNLTYYIEQEVYIVASLNSDTGRVKKRTGVKSESGELTGLPRASQRILDRIKLMVESHVSKCLLGKSPILKKDIEDVITEAKTGKKPTTKAGLLLTAALQSYMDKAKEGTALNYRGDRHSKSTIGVIKTLLYHINNDKVLGKIAINQLTELHIKHFRQKLTTTEKMRGEGYISKNTIATYNNVLMAFIEATYEMGWHTNRITKTDRLHLPGEAVDYPIYYSIEELQKLMNHKFTGHKERVRDVFVFGCFTCLRHSDYYQTDYTKAYNGREIVTKLKKKGNQIKIPLHPVALMILQKYNFVIPLLPMNNLNRNIKEVCKDAGFTEPVLFSRTEGGALRKEYIPKYKLTASHTMRRSFATNALKMGSQEWEVMAIGGWRSESAFKKYKRMSEEDVTNAAFNSAFYQVNM